PYVSGLIIQYRAVHYFFFRAVDGIRDFHVTGVQTCALPIFAIPMPTEDGFCFVVDGGANTEVRPEHLHGFAHMGAVYVRKVFGEIGRASCRERVKFSAVSLASFKN